MALLLSSSCAPICRHGSESREPLFAAGFFIELANFLGAQPGVMIGAFYRRLFQHGEIRQLADSDRPFLPPSRENHLLPWVYQDVAMLGRTQAEPSGIIAAVERRPLGSVVHPPRLDRGGLPGVARLLGRGVGRAQREGRRRQGPTCHGTSGRDRPFCPPRLRMKDPVRAQSNRSRRPRKPQPGQPLLPPLAVAASEGEAVAAAAPELTGGHRGIGGA